MKKKKILNKKKTDCRDTHVKRGAIRDENKLKEERNAIEVFYRNNLAKETGVVFKFLDDAHWYFTYGDKITQIYLYKSQSLLIRIRLHRGLNKIKC